jgi:hypothetical protein
MSQKYNFTKITIVCCFLVSFVALGDATTYTGTPAEIDNKYRNMQLPKNSCRGQLLKKQQS